MKPLLKNKITFERAKSEPKLCLGIYGKTDALYWCGFGFSETEGVPKLQMRVERKASKPIIESLEDALSKATPDKKDYPAWLNFYLPIGIDTEYNGNAEEIYKWLLNASKEISKLGAK